MPENQCRPAPARAVTIVRAHRIHINDVPALFSEGLEPEPEPLELGSFWRANLGLSFKQLLLQCWHFLLPPQAGNEKPVGAATVRRQPQAQTRA
jgi:hypothetical protein